MVGSYEIGHVYVPLKQVQTRGTDETTSFLPESTFARILKTEAQADRLLGLAGRQQLAWMLIRNGPSKLGAVCLH